MQDWERQGHLFISEYQLHELKMLKTANIESSLYFSFYNPEKSGARSAQSFACTERRIRCSLL